MSGVTSATPQDPAPVTDAALCARCSSGFQCGARSDRCWCADVMLDDKVRSDMALFYDGCLCPDCLRTIEDARPARPNVWAFLRKNLKRRRQAG